MSSGYYLVAAAYLVLTVVLFLIERKRIRRTGPDAITIFMVLFALQTCVSGVVIAGTLPIVGRFEPTGTWFIDNIVRQSDPIVLLAVLALTAGFAIFFYVGCALGALLLRTRDQLRRPPLRLTVNGRRLSLVLAGGAGLTFLSFWLLGDTIVTRYANLVLLRGDYALVERTALNSNAFSLTQTWTWLSVIPLFIIAKRRGIGLAWWGCFLLTLSFALMGVSRRAIFLPLLIAYLGLALATKRWRPWWVVAATGPLIFWVAFGKDLLATMAYGGTVQGALDSYASWVNAVFRAASDIGTTVIESMGTIALIDLPPRYGIDHILSAAQRIPDGMLGLNIEWPERMVRISTRIFVSDDQQDIPPGMMGQMWLDFRILGPVVWGLVFGLQMSVVQHFWQRTRRTLEAAVVFVVIIFAVALPVNSGTFDFTFSVDIIALALVLYWCCTLRPERPAPSTPASP